jgi:CO/xanthine dehydrogenase Mo-binding subunit
MDQTSTGAGEDVLGAAAAAIASALSDRWARTLRKYPVMPNRVQVALWRLEGT